jgi:DNA-binding beta-propeller fold protein YncE
VIANVITGCQPVRVAVSPDGQTVWVTARGSDALLGFAADKLTTDPTRALVTDVRVGEAPVGLAVSRDGRQIIVADSNRFDVPGANSDLTIIDADRTGNDRLSVVGHVAAGLFPRDVSLDPAGVLIATDYGSDQITLLNTTQLGSAERSLSPG